MSSRPFSASQPQHRRPHLLPHPPRLCPSPPASTATGGDHTHFFFLPLRPLWSWRVAIASLSSSPSPQPTQQQPEPATSSPPTTGDFPLCISLLHSCEPPFPLHLLQSTEPSLPLANTSLLPRLPTHTRPPFSLHNRSRASSSSSDANAAIAVLFLCPGSQHPRRPLSPPVILLKPIVLPHAQPLSLSTSRASAPIPHHRLPLGPHAAPPSISTDQTIDPLSLHRHHHLSPAEQSLITSPFAPAPAVGRLTLRPLHPPQGKRLLHHPRSGEPQPPASSLILDAAEPNHLHRHFPSHLHRAFDLHSS